MLYLVPPLCTTRLNANDFKECYLCNTQGRLYEESYSLLTGHWFFLKVFCTLIIHGLKGNFPSSLRFSCIFLHISTMVSVLHPQSELSCSPIYSFSTVNSLCDKHIYILNWWLHSAALTHTNTAFRWTSESSCAAWLQGLCDLGEYVFSQIMHVSRINL